MARLILTKELKMKPKYSIPTNHLLKVTCSPEEYLSLLKETSRWFRPSKEQLGYLPSYTIARCPFCNAAYATYIDTHSILPWYIYDDYRSIFKLFNSLPVIEDLLLNGDPSQHKDIGCHHLFAFQTFFHLQGNIPVETERFSNIIGDVPYVMPIWLPDDLPSMAVIHSLPVCRIEQGEFVPRYALYTIAYYAYEGKMILDRRLAEERQKAEGDDEYYPLILRPQSEIAFDLPYWLEKGKLAWLDYTNPELPLQTGPLSAFPYAQIRGFRRKYDYIRRRNGGHFARYFTILMLGKDGIIISYL
jgi:hypothetical protein